MIDVEDHTASISVTSSPAGTDSPKVKNAKHQQSRHESGCQFSMPAHQYRGFPLPERYQRRVPILLLEVTRKSRIVRLTSFVGVPTRSEVLINSFLARTKLGIDEDRPKATDNRFRMEMARTSGNEGNSRRKNGPALARGGF
jgi:hypothetical protein